MQICTAAKPRRAENMIRVRFAELFYREARRQEDRDPGIFTEPFHVFLFPLEHKIIEYVRFLGSNKGKHYLKRIN
jgi:hypothetical protein